MQQTTSKTTHFFSHCSYTVTPYQIECRTRPYPNAVEGEDSPRMRIAIVSGSESYVSSLTYTYSWSYTYSVRYIENRGEGEGGRDRERGRGRKRER